MSANPSSASTSPDERARAAEPLTRAPTLADLEVDGCTRTHPISPHLRASMTHTRHRSARLRRTLVVALLVAIGCPAVAGAQRNVVGPHGALGGRQLVIKGRGPMTGYDRAQFGSSWADVDRNGCDTRDDILRRDLRAAHRARRDARLRDHVGHPRRPVHGDADPLRARPLRRWTSTTSSRSETRGSSAPRAGRPASASPSRTIRSTCSRSAPRRTGRRATPTRPRGCRGRRRTAARTWRVRSP